MQAHSTRPRSTDVYHDGEEVAVRASSRFSRGYHTPKTDDDGVVFVDDAGDRVPEDHDDARPLPECGKDTEGRWKLVPIRSVANRDLCSNCADDPDAIAKRNSKGSGNVTLARLAQRGDWQGEESLSASATHTSDD